MKPIEFPEVNTVFAKDQPQKLMVSKPALTTKEPR